MSKLSKNLSKKLPVNEFPALYHAHHSRYPEDIPFWVDLAKKQDGPILELGCGTGRVLLPLAEVCESVFGLDHDPNMLAFLRQSLPSALSSHINVWLADLEAFHLATRFSLIILPCNTFSTLSEKKRRKMLALVQYHLKPGGRFVTSMPNPKYLMQLPATADPEIEDIFPHPVDEEPVQVSSSWERIDQTFSIFWDYDHLLPDGRVDRIRAQAIHHLSTLQTYTQELSSAGFERPILLGDFDGSPYMDDSPYLILISDRN